MFPLGDKWLKDHLIKIEVWCGDETGLSGGRDS